MSRIGRHPLLWLIAAAMALGTLRALAVPPGLYNIDERWHFEPILSLTRSLQTCIESRACDAVLAFLTQRGGSTPYRGVAYYLPQSIVQLALPLSVGESQRLLVARLVTLSLNGFIIGWAYLTIRELFPRQRPLALATAGLAAFIPSFSEMMSGVNVDAGAAFVGALIIYTLARIIRRGLTLARLTALVVEVGLGYTLKVTVWPLLLVVVFVFWLRLSGRFRLAAVGLVVLGGAAALVGFKPINWRGTANWFYQRPHDTTGLLLPPRVEVLSPVGQHSLQGGDFPIVQYLPERVVKELRGKDVTYGVWTRALEGAVTVPTPFFGSDGQSTGELDLSTTWQFYARVVLVPPDAEHLGFWLGAPVLYDGMVVAEGVFPIDQAPDYSIGTWGGMKFVNLLENYSAEAGWPQVGSYDGQPYFVNYRIAAILAWRRTLPAWFDLIRWLLVNFWSGFGGILPGLSSAQMIPPGLLTALAWAGVALVVVRDLPRRTSPFEADSARLGFWMLAAAALAVILLVMYRADLLPNQPTMLIWASVRHASAGRIALTALLAMGLLRWVPRRWQRWTIAIGLVALFWLNAYIFLQVQYPFQHCALPVAIDCLSTVH
ncbi:MAG: hypothetical protein AAB427_16625 [Chloroflexota bacterium]